MKIFDKDDNTLLTVLETADAAHEVELMKSDLVRLSWNDAEFYIIKAGSYIKPFTEDYPDLKYTLWRDYVPEETASGFRYQPEFQHPVMRLAYVPFGFNTKDAEGNDIIKYEYPYVGRLGDIMEQLRTEIKKELKLTDDDLFDVVYSVNKEQTVSISISDNDILSVLSKLADAVECEYHFKWETDEKLLEFGKVQNTILGMPVLKVGEHLNEPSVSKSNEIPYNRYIVLGSTRNMVRETKDGNTGKGRYISTGLRLTLNETTYPNSIIDLRTDKVHTPATTGFLVYDDVYPKLELSISSVIERKKYKVDENGYPTNERWSIWYVKLNYLNSVNEYKLIGQTSGSNTSLTCNAIETVSNGSAQDSEVVGYVTDLPWGDYIPNLYYRKKANDLKQKNLIVKIDSTGRTYRLGAEKKGDKVMLCRFSDDARKYFDEQPDPIVDEFDDFKTAMSGRTLPVTLAVTNADMSKAPSQQITDRSANDDRVDGLVPTIAFRIKENDQNGSKLGTREFEVEFHTEKVDVNAKDDVSGQNDIPEGYYEIIHTEEGDGLVMPTTFEQGIIPKVGDQVTMFNIHPGSDRYQNMVNAAKAELLEKAQATIDSIYNDGNTYTFKINPIDEEENIDHHTSWYEVGNKIRYALSDTTFDKNGNVLTGKIREGRILSVKTNLDYEFCKEITVGDAVQKGKIAQLLSKVNGSGTSTGTGGSSSGSKANQLTEDDVEEIAKQYAYSGDCLTPLLFELHKADDGADTVIDPEEWESEIEADEEAREDAESHHQEYVTPLSIKSKYGHCTDYFMSALGIGSGSGGDGTALEWPLLQINNQGMAEPGVIGGPSTGDAIVFDQTLNGGAGGFKWGKTGGGLSGLHIFDGATEIQPMVSGDSYTYRLSDNFLSLRSNTTQNVQSPLLLTGNVAITGANLAITNGTLTIASRPQGFAAGDNDVLTKKETETLFDGKYVTVAFFQSLFELHQGDANNTLIPTNTDLSDYTQPQKELFNIKSLFGTWTEQYLSALGIGSDGSSGGVAYLSLLEDVNVGTLSPTDNGKALIYDSTLDKWVKGSAGIDTNQLNTILHGKTLIITDGSVQLGNTWYADAGGSIDISTIFTRKKWWNATMSNGEVKGDIQLTGNITPETNDTAADPGSTIGTTALRYRAIYVNEIYIGDAKISWDSTNRGVHLSKAVYSDEWVSALGTGSSGGSGGLDLELMWEALGGTYLTREQISTDHLANVTKTLTLKVGSTTYTYNGTANVGPIDLSAGGADISEYSWWGAGMTGKKREGNMTNVGSITVTAADYGKKAITGFHNISLYHNGETNGNGGHLDFLWNNASAYTSRISEGASGRLDINNTIFASLSGNVGIGNSSPSAKLDVSGDMRVTQKLYLYKHASDSTKDVYFEYVNGQSGVHLSGAGFYADTYVSSLGVGSQGGAGGINLDDVWDSLTTHGDSYGSSKIDNNHLNLGTLTINGEQWNPTSGNKTINITTGGTITGASDHDSYFTGTVAKSASKWATARNFTIKDADSTNSGTAVSVDGSDANGYTLLLPSIIKATLTGNVTGNADTATKLKSKAWLWGNQFDGSQNIGYYDSENGQAVNANLSYVNNISMVGAITGCTSIDTTLYFIKSNNTISQVNIGSDTAATYTNGNSTNTPKLYVNGDFGVNGNVFAKAVELYNTSPYIDFHNGNSTDDYTTRIIENASGVLTVRASGSGATGLVVSNSSAGRNGDYIRIGGATISWDYTNQALHIDKGVYSDSFVSSLGTGSSGGSGGGTLYGLSLTSTTLSLVPDGQQSSVNLSNAIGLYLSTSSYVTGLTINGQSTGISVSNHTINIDNVVRKVKVGTMEYTPLQNGTVELPEGGGAYTLPAASDNALGGIKIGFTDDATNRYYGVKLSLETASKDKAYVNVPWTDEKVKVIKADPSSSTEYYLTFYGNVPSTSEIGSQYVNKGLKYETSANNKTATLEIGNYDSTAAYQKTGAIRLCHTQSNKKGTIQTTTLSANRTYTLPDNTGTIALTSDLIRKVKMNNATHEPTISALDTIDLGTVVTGITVNGSAVTVTNGTAAIIGTGLTWTDLLSASGHSIGTTSNLDNIYVSGFIKDIDANGCELVMGHGAGTLTTNKYLALAVYDKVNVIGSTSSPAQLFYYNYNNRNIYLGNTVFSTTSSNNSRGKVFITGKNVVIRSVDDSSSTARALTTVRDGGVVIGINDPTSTDARFGTTIDQMMTNTGDKLFVDGSTVFGSGVRTLSDVTPGRLMLTYWFQKVNGSDTSNWWHRLGNYTFSDTGSQQIVIELFAGSGYNGNASQNSNAKITLKHAWQANPLAQSSVGVTCERYSATCNIEVRVNSITYNTGEVWILVPVDYGNGFYRISGTYTSWEHNDETPITSNYANDRPTADYTSGGVTTYVPNHNNNTVGYYSGGGGDYLPLTGGTLSAGSNADPLALNATRGYTVTRYLMSNTFKWSVGCDTDKFYWYSGGTSSIVLSILNNGNVGIGTTTPGNYKLYVSGSMYCDNFAGFGIATQSAPWQFAAKYAYVSTGLSIGGKNSGYNLYVSGSSYLQGTLTTTGNIQSSNNVLVNGMVTVGGHDTSSGDNNGKLSLDSDDNLLITTGNHIYLKKQTVASSNLTVGQASLNDSYNFYVNGTSYFTGDVHVADGKYLYLQGVASDSSKVYMLGNARHQLSIYAASIYFNGVSIHSSDIRLKDVHENLNIDVEDIARAPIFNFSWKKNPEYGWQLGSSAQYWQNVFRYGTDVSDEGYLGMDYGATALAAAVMTARTVLTHEERIKALEAENERLRTEIELLKAA